MLITARQKGYWRMEERKVILFFKGDIQGHFGNWRYFRGTLKLKLAKE